MHMVVQRGNCRRVGGGGRGGGSGEGVKVEKRKFTEQASCHNKVWLQQGMWHRCTQRSTQYRMPNKATPVKFMHVRKICQEHNKIVSFTEIQQVLKKKKRWQTLVTKAKILPSHTSTIKQTRSVNGPMQANAR